MQEKILLVDDDKLIRFSLTKILQEAGYTILEAKNAQEAIIQITAHEPEIVLLDHKMPDHDGIWVLEKSKEQYPDIQFIMFTSFADVKNAVLAMKMGAYDYLTKPIESEELILVIEKALQSYRLKEEVQQLKQRLEEKLTLNEIMGESPAVQKLLQIVSVVADTPLTLLLSGETGTGKGFLARLIHNKSNRRNKPFITVNCGAIPETLFESELFGHEKGAFTGAEQIQIGKFEQALGGTIFLDEINTLTFAMQAKLLSVIEDRSTHRLGGNKAIHLDVRIIAAANSDLWQEMKDGNFRGDLFHRLNEFSLHIPPLRERKDDLPILAEYFMRDAMREYGKTELSFSPAAFQKLVSYSWPGNIRELRNVIKRAVLLSSASEVTPDALVLIEELQELKSNNWHALAKQIEIKEIKDALEKTGNNKNAAAKLLGISRAQFYRKLNKYELL